MVKSLAGDPVALSQLVGGVAYEVVLIKEKQIQIWSITREQMDEVSRARITILQ